MNSREYRLKRLKIRAWRRGMKEMDLILGTFVNEKAAGLAPAELDALEALMEENDADLYPWFTGQADVPPQHTAILQKIQGEVKLY